MLDSTPNNAEATALIRGFIDNMVAEAGTAQDDPLNHFTPGYAASVQRKRLIRLLFDEVATDRERLFLSMAKRADDAERTYDEDGLHMAGCTLEDFACDVSAISEEIFARAARAA